MPAQAQDRETLFHEATKDFLAGRYAQALAAYETMVQTSPRDVRLLYNIAVCQEKLGRTGTALNTYKRVVALDSTHNRAQSAMERLGRRETPTERVRTPKPTQRRPTPKTDRASAAPEAAEAVPTDLRAQEPTTQAGTAAAASTDTGRPQSVRIAEAPGISGLGPQEAPVPVSDQGNASGTPVALVAGAHSQARLPSAKEQVQSREQPRTPASAATQPTALPRDGFSSYWIPVAISLGVLVLLLMTYLWGRRRAGYAVQGWIRQFPVADVLQILAQSHKTGILIINTPQGTARLYLDAGSISGADIQAQSQEQAIYTILGLKDGTFIFQESARLPKQGQGLNLSIEHALLNWAYLEDESRRNPGSPQDAKRVHRN